MLSMVTAVTVGCGVTVSWVDNSMSWVDSVDWCTMMNWLRIDDSMNGLDVMDWLGIVDWLCVNDSMLGSSVVSWLSVNRLHHWLAHWHCAWVSLRVSVTSWLHSFDFINYKNFKLHSN